MKDKILSDLKICVVGLGYVGLPLAVSFSEQEVDVIGFDIDNKRTEELKENKDSSGEITDDRLKNTEINFTSNPEDITEANFFIVTVPTPLKENKEPNLSHLKSASKTVGSNMQEGSTVVFESTVYPGVVENKCLPILEKSSGFSCPEDFWIGYSPERVNPGSEEHTIEKITKIVSGVNKEATDLIAEVYSKVVNSNIHKASDIQTAEAAKVIENIQRDLNIALMNELSLIFNKLDLNTQEVLEAAGTKWNFHDYHPGLVGGHCIGVDPYYLVHKVKKENYDPQLLLAGRGINERMPGFVAEELIKLMIKADKTIKNSKVSILGLAFKEDVQDVRNSKAKDLINHLKDYEIEVIGHEPYASDHIIQEHFGIKNFEFGEIEDVDAQILFNQHKKFKGISVKDLKGKYKGKPVLFDVKNFFDKNELEKHNFYYSSL